MQIKTITCHNVYNAGASLQAYALSRYLSNLGHDVHIIDYQPSYLQHYPLFGANNPKYDKPVVRMLYSLAKLPGRFLAYFEKRKRNFDVFSKRYLPTTARTYHTYDELLAAPPEADVYIAGSDQIWNTVFENGKDPSFYLQFAPEGSVTASYAASFATQSIEPEWRDKVSEWLRALNHISVRESSGVEILADMGLHGQAVLDPVFLLSQRQWRELFEARNNLEPYVFVYDFDNNPEIRRCAEALAQKYRYKIYTYQKRDYGDRCFWDCGPLEFLSLIDHAELILSNSFHATAFSVILQKQFFVFNRAEKINTRMRDLLSAFALSDRLITEEKETRKRHDIDYDKVKEDIEAAIRRSKEYIAQILSK